MSSLLADFSSAIQVPKAAPMRFESAGVIYWQVSGAPLSGSMFTDRSLLSFHRLQKYACKSFRISPSCLC